MRTLLMEGFKRLEGKSASSPGTFLLSQSMGGGKTHNLVALGLLAKHPTFREPVMEGFHTPSPLGAVRVVAFSGRETNTPFGLWGVIADRLGKKAVFNDFYQPLMPPGKDDWVELLKGEPVLILLDELPPYFEAVKAVQVGATHLDSLTTTAIANLIAALDSGKLPQACLVVTDLSGKAYTSGSDAVTKALEGNAALSDLQQEVTRNVVRIDPVRLNTNELYDILRTRLFKDIEAANIPLVAEGYRQSVDKARLMDITAATPEEVKAEIESAYPFNPAIRDLYARFKENPGFQQTRALIRIMRIMVASLWNSGAAKEKFLIGAEDIDLHDQGMLSEMRQINATLDAAVAHDIADEKGASVAEQLDKSLGGHDAADTARMLYLSSLSLAVNPTLGLERSDIVRYLAAPNRDLTQLNGVIDRLQQDAWYLHATTTGRLFFKNTENLNAKLEAYTRGKLKEQREAELRPELEKLYAPVVKSGYQDLKVLPPLDTVQLKQDSVTLVVFKPEDDSKSAIEKFYNEQTYKNRVCFLTSEKEPYTTVLERAARLSSINAIIAEMQRTGIREADPQFQEAQQILSKQVSLFYMACREAFTILYYPTGTGIQKVEVDNQYPANQYKGEESVLKALGEAFKYKPDTTTNVDQFRVSVENKLWNTGETSVQWNTIKYRAATNPGWVWHHPNALDSLKTELVRRDIWRESMGYVERGPFPLPTTSVLVQDLQRDDNTGEVTLKITPLHGDIVYMSTNGPATTASERMDTYTVKTNDLQRSFLCVDSSGEHDTGEAASWQNSITLKRRFFQDGTDRKCEIRAIPTGDILYTTDGSSTETSGVRYTGPFVVPGDCHLILAIAKKGAVQSAPGSFPVPQNGGGGPEPVHVDPNKPARWLRKQQFASTKDVFDFLAVVRKHDAQMGGVHLVNSLDTAWVEFNSEKTMKTPAEAIETMGLALKDFVAGGSLSIEVKTLTFDSGRQLLDMVADLKTELKPGEVLQ